MYMHIHTASIRISFRDYNLNLNSMLNSIELLLLVLIDLPSTVDSLHEPGDEMKMKMKTGKVDRTQSTVF